MLSAWYKHRVFRQVFITAACIVTLKLWSVPPPPPHTHTHTHTQTLRLDVQCSFICVFSFRCIRYYSLQAKTAADSSWTWFDCESLDTSTCAACATDPAACAGYGYAAVFDKLACKPSITSPSLQTCYASGSCNDEELSNTITGQLAVCVYPFSVTQCGVAKCPATTRRVSAGCAQDAITDEASCTAFGGSWTVSLFRCALRASNCIAVLCSMRVFGLAPCVLSLLSVAGFPLLQT